MKKIGILGGLNLLEAYEYKHLLTQQIAYLKGENGRVKLLPSNASYVYLEACYRHEQYREVVAYLSSTAQKLEQEGANVIVLASEELHRFAPEIAKAITIPLPHIVDTTAQEVQRHRFSKIGFLGSSQIAQAPFYFNRFWQQGIELMTPSEEQCQLIDAIISKELVLDVFNKQSGQVCLEVVQELIERGAQAIVLGCTQLKHLLTVQGTSLLPLFDTKTLHCRKAVRLLLEMEANNSFK